MSEAGKKRRVISGMRPTGRLHIGNYFGALANWVKLQNDPSNECFFFIADWHSLTSDYADTSQIAQNTIEVMIDFLAGGLDPEKSVIFLQSSVPEHAELHLLLSMITPLGWLERVPTYKEAIENVKGKDLYNYGFLGYPVLQTADIVIYGKDGVPLVVPVGEDQVAHIELSREIVRRMNFFYGWGFLPSLSNDERVRAFREAFRNSAPGQFVPVSEDEMSFVLSHARSNLGLDEFLLRVRANPQYFQHVPVLVEPDAMLTQTPRIPGLDGRKMSKSYGNAIELGESDESIRAKTKVMMTDPARKRRTDAGNPDICPVYDWHKLFSPPETLSWSNVGCRTAGIGCIECKSAMADNLIKWIAPIRARRAEYAARPDRVLELIDAGSKRARGTAQATMERVREAVFGWKAKRESVASDAQAGELRRTGAGD